MYNTHAKYKRKKTHNPILRTTTTIENSHYVETGVTQFNDA
jgi:hypothetical protein